MSADPRDPSQSASRRARIEKSGDTAARPRPGPAESSSTRRLSQAAAQDRNAGPIQSPSTPVLPRQPVTEPESPAGPSVFVPAAGAPEPRHGRWPLFGSIFLFFAAIVAVGIMVAWPRLYPPSIAAPRRGDPVERAAADYLKALSADDSVAITKLGTVEEPPAIRSYRSPTRIRRSDLLLKGSFAPLGKFHARIDAEYSYDPSIARFSPKNPMGPAAETLDKLHAAKEDAEKSGLYKKMQSGDPEDLFDAAEQFGKVFTQLAEGTLAPKKILPTYRMLVDESKPPLPAEAKALALEVAAGTKNWDAMLKRSFHTLKADGPFIFERAEVQAMATDRLASSGDPTSRLRLSLVRFRLEGIDSGWKVIAINRILPGEEANKAEPTPTPRSASPPSSRSPGEPSSLHDEAGSPKRN